MVINVEYNQLDPLLRATGHPDGDVNCETGYSPYPGNINQVRSNMKLLSSCANFIIKTICIFPIFTLLPKMLYFFSIPKFKIRQLLGWFVFICCLKCLGSWLWIR